MLSDEENKMLEIFKKEVEKEQNEYEQVNEYTKFYYNNHKFILNLIEKQSKEIEGLKEDNKKKSIVIIEYQDLYEKLVDKIKAKIEEVKDGTYDAKIVLQSLLNEEE